VISRRKRRESERETLHKYERELEELKDDLTNLAVGGFVDRLPFKDPKPARHAAPKQRPSRRRPTPDAWKSVPLADVWREAGANVALLALLDGRQDQGRAAQGSGGEIRTLGDLAAFTSQPAREADGHQRHRAGEGRRDRDGGAEAIGEAPAGGAAPKVSMYRTAQPQRPASTGSR
jgi:hypothetical protein